MLFAYPALSWASSYLHSSSYHHSCLCHAGDCACTDDAQGVGAADHAAGDARVPTAGPSGIPSFCVSGLWKGLSEVQESVTEYIIMSDLDTAMSARLISLRCCHAHLCQYSKLWAASKTPALVTKTLRLNFHVMLLDILQPGKACLNARDTLIPRTKQLTIMNLICSVFC